MLRHKEPSFRRCCWYELENGQRIHPICRSFISNIGMLGKESLKDRPVAQRLEALVIAALLLRQLCATIRR